MEQTTPIIGEQVSPTRAMVPTTAELLERADKAKEQCDMLARHLTQLSSAAKLMKQFIQQTRQESAFYKFLSKMERKGEAERQQVINAMCYWFD